MSSLVGDVMPGNVVSVREQAQCKEITLVMRERGFSVRPVPDVATRSPVTRRSEEEIVPCRLPRSRSWMRPSAVA